MRDEQERWTARDAPFRSLGTVEGTTEDPADTPAVEMEPDLQTGLRGLVAVAQYHGIDLSFERLRDSLTSPGEPPAEQLAAIARREGMHSAAKKMNWSQLKALGSSTPFLARLSNSRYVVITHAPSIFAARTEAGTETTPESVLILNPRSAETGLFPVERALFESHWTGEIVLLKRNFKLGEERSRFDIGWFVPEFWRQRHIFKNVILAAVAINFLALAVPLFFQLVIDRVLIHMSLSTLEVLTIGVGIAVLFHSILTWLRSYFTLHASAKMDIRLARQSFMHLMGLPIDYFEHVPAGVVAKNIQQASIIREFLTGRALMTLLDLPILLIFLPLLLFYSIPLTLVVLLATMLLGGLVAAMIGPFRSRLQKLYTAEAERQSLLVESIHGMRTVKALGLEARQQRAWEDSAAAVATTSLEVGAISQSANALSSLIEKALTILVVVIGAFIVFHGKMTVGQLVAFQMLSGRVIGPILQLIGLVHQMQEVLLSVRMLGDVMNRPVERNLGHGLAPSFRGRIDFENVTFRYPGSQRPALDNVSFSIPAGCLVGIVGKSGSGKTTLSALLQGLYTASEGVVRIDGHDSRVLDKSILRRQLAVVAQDSFLFRGTVKENIQIGCPYATLQEVIEAAQLAGAGGFIEELPQGYETTLEESGANLSGGQRQRLSIARAVLRRAPILLFDEATSALDPDTEAIVVKNLARFARGRTTIIISHRLQTIRSADTILVLDQGKIVDQGDHETLLGRNFIYSQLWSQQMGRPRDL